MLLKLELSRVDLDIVTSVNSDSLKGAILKHYKLPCSWETPLTVEKLFQDPMLILSQSQDMYILQYANIVISCMLFTYIDCLLVQVQFNCMCLGGLCLGVKTKLLKPALYMIMIWLQLICMSWLCVQHYKVGYNVILLLIKFVTFISVCYSGQYPT